MYVRPCGTPSLHEFYIDCIIVKRFFEACVIISMNFMRKVYLRDLSFLKNVTCLEVAELDI